MYVSNYLRLIIIIIIVIERESHTHSAVYYKKETILQLVYSNIENRTTNTHSTDTVTTQWIFPRLELYLLLYIQYL